MRLEPSEPENESQFYARLHGRILGRIYTERVEPANESGFPDVYFVMRDGSGEGTIELKFARTAEPNLKSLMRGNQKASLLDYFEAGGRRRFALCYCNGMVYFWRTVDFVGSIKTDGKRWTDRCAMAYPRWDLKLPEWLEMK